jgi:hypothetical protein
MFGERKAMHDLADIDALVTTKLTPFRRIAEGTEREEEADRQMSGAGHGPSKPSQPRADKP